MQLSNNQYAKGGGHQFSASERKPNFQGIALLAARAPPQKKKVDSYSQHITEFTTYFTTDDLDL